MLVLLLAFFRRRLPIDEVLRCQGFNFPSWCSVCNNNGETFQHLLMECGYANSILDYISWLFEKFLVLYSSTMKAFMSRQVFVLWHVAVVACFNTI